MTDTRQLPFTNPNWHPPLRDTRGLTRCWQNSGWHVYGAGPCFTRFNGVDGYDKAIQYRDSLDDEGITWRPQ